MLKKIIAAALGLFVAAAFAASTDVNKATLAELETIKGVGPGIATKIIDERKKGAFKDWNDLVERVKGVGDGNAARLSADGMTVNGAAFKATAATAPASKKDEMKAAKTEAKAKKDDMKADAAAKKDAMKATPVAAAATPATPAVAATPAMPAKKAEAAMPAASATKAAAADEARKATAATQMVRPVAPKASEPAKK